MEWLWSILALFWLLSGSSNDEDKKSECNEDKLAENKLDEDELETEEKEVKKIKDDPHTMPTVTRVSKTDLRNKPVNRPTVINRRE